MFYLFRSCDLDLDPMTFIYHLTGIPGRYIGCANMNIVRQGFWKIVVWKTHRQTYRKTDRQTHRI